MGKYLLKYGPEVLDWSDTLADARQKRKDRIAAGEPSSLYIYRPSTQTRWY